MQTGLLIHIHIRIQQFAARRHSRSVIMSNLAGTAASSSKQDDRDPSLQAITTRSNSPASGSLSPAAPAGAKTGANLQLAINANAAIRALLADREEAVLERLQQASDHLHELIDNLEVEYLAKANLASMATSSTDPRLLHLGPPKSDNAHRKQMEDMIDLLRRKDEAMERVIKEHEETLRRLVQAHEETIRYISQGREETAKAFINKMPSSVLPETYQQ